MGNHGGAWPTGEHATVGFGRLGLGRGLVLTSRSLGVAKRPSFYGGVLLKGFSNSHGIRASLQEAHSEWEQEMEGRGVYTRKDRSFFSSSHFFH